MFNKMKTNKTVLTLFLSLTVFKVSRVLSTGKPEFEDCPDGYTLYMNKCTRIAFAEPSMKCHKGILENDQCVMKEIVKPNYVCDSDYEQYNVKHCKREQVSMASFVCPKGYDRGDGECTRTESFNPIVKCEHGYKLDGSQCVKVKHEHVSYECDGGYTLDHKYCYAQEETDAIIGCPKGYYQSTGISGETDCVKTLEAHMKSTCPSDYLLNKDGICVRTTSIAPHISCEAGYTLEHGKCKVAESRSPIESCKHGYERVNDKCFIRKEVRASYDCPIGYKKSKENHECIQKSISAPKIVCAEGIYKKGKCVIEENVEPTYECMKDEMLVDGQCIKSYSHESTRRCTKGYYEEGGQCIRRETMKASYICPHGEGYSLHGHECIRQTTEKPLLDCPHDKNLVNGECISETYENIQPYCEKSYKYNDVTNMCERIILSKPQHVCENDGILNKNKCEVQLEANSFLECPKSYTLDSSGLCSSTNTMQASLICPMGMSLHGDKCKVNIESDKHNTFDVKNVHSKTHMKTRKSNKH